MAAPTYSLTPQERTFYKTLYDSIHGKPSGIPADAVVSLFAKATPNLSTSVLGEIWNLADYQSSGTLTPQGFDIACRLVGHAQAGQTASQDLINKVGPLPKFEGFAQPGLAVPPPVSRPTTSVNTSFANARVTPADREKFLRIFSSQQPSNGLLGGDKASQVFLKSNLPPTTLADVWRLADTKERGELDSTDFIVGMHLVQKLMAGAMQAPLPAMLPPGLYESAAASGSSSVPSLPPAASIPRQFTGQQVAPPPNSQSPLRQQYTGQQPFGRQQTGNVAGWSITSAEKTQSDTWFDGLQRNADGLLEGPAAVEFFMQSTLDQTTLAAIWDLCDMRNSGTLNKDEFAVATRLINDQLDGKPLPTTLPNDLIPPSQRTGAPARPQQQGSSAVERDLFSLLDDDEPVSSSPALAVVPAPRSVASPPPRSVASPAPSASRIASPPPATSRTMTKSPEQSNAFPAPSGIEIGNLKNQLSSTTSSLERTRGDRAQLETAVSNSSSELASLQAQLEAARTAYTTESSLLSSLQTRAANQTSELAELRSKLITAESDLSGLRVERAEVEQSVLRDKEEIRGLKAKIAEMDRETERLKAEAETKRKDARQQKGMVAITRKQVERSEEQRGRAREDLASIGSEPAAIERAASPTSLASPAGSVRSTNPFERMTSPLGSVAMPSAPIPALSPQPTGTSTAAKALSPQPTGSRAAPPPPPSRAKSPSTDVPTSSFSAASIGAAVAAGATAAVGAVAATVSAVVGGDDEKAPSVDTSEIGKSPVQAGQEPRKSTEERFPDLEAPAPASGPSAPSGLSAFDDAFGVVPNATGSQAPPMPSTSTAAFDEAFGAPAPVTASAPTGFDDAFAEPTSTAAPSTGFDDAFASTGTPTAPSAGFDDAFGTSASAPASSAPPAFDDAFATTASPPAQATVGADEASSDEEDDGPEPAEGYKYGRSTSAGSGAIGAGSIERSPFEELPPALPTDYASGGSADPVARPPSAAPSSVDAFEDAQQNVMSSPAPAPTATAARASASMDDFDAFDREFDDLPTESGAAAPTIKTSNNSTVLPDDDDDDFDKAFDKLDDFAPPPAAASHAPASHGAAAPSSSAFDSAFADFDQSPPHSATAPPHGDGGFGSAFDDSFDAPPPVSQGLPAGAGAPALPARKPTAAGAQEDDVPAVKEVCGLGFTRPQAIQALEKHSYNVQAAINSLLDAQ